MESCFNTKKRKLTKIKTMKKETLRKRYQHLVGQLDDLLGQPKTMELIEKAKTATKKPKVKPEPPKVDLSIITNDVDVFYLKTNHGYQYLFSGNPIDTKEKMCYSFQYKEIHKQNRPITVLERIVELRRATVDEFDLFWTSQIKDGDSVLVGKPGSIRKTNGVVKDGCIYYYAFSNETKILISDEFQLIELKSGLITFKP